MMGMCDVAWLPWLPLTRASLQTRSLMRGLSGRVHVQIHKFLKDRAPPESPRLPYSWCSMLVGEQLAWGSWGDTGY